MTKVRRTKLGELLSEVSALNYRLGELKSEIEQVKNEEESIYKRIPENLKWSERGKESDDTIDYLDGICSAIDEATYYLDEAMSDWEEEWE